jgi:AcrR family transcriptional regulator
MPAKTKKKTSRSAKFENKLEEIVSIATALFSEVGFKAGTTTTIAKRAGLTQPALYYYVGSKTALLALICNRMGAQFMEPLNDIEAMELPPEEKLARFLRAHTEVMLRETKAFKVYVTETRHLPGRYQEKIRAEEHEYVQSVTAILKDAQAAGALPAEVDPWIATQVLLGMMNWSFKWYREHGRVSADQVVDTVLAFALQGIGADRKAFVTGGAR